MAPPTTSHGNNNASDEHGYLSYDTVPTGHSIILKTKKAAQTVQPFRYLCATGTLRALYILRTEPAYDGGV
ncbi:hypothetical protein GCM10017044_09020 [Kordiimonas sediminis]|uniref:Uncharacterized protein n=1 Tax=Kordiimonas sediminis TaxID=1735581 RepID=A0A919AQF5_9PROT|nr:hypothetical protein GCM10017044_09020 [Kordiimonas sediminis]